MSDFYTAQAMRLSVLRDFPRGYPEGIAELAAALERAGGDRAFTQLLVDDFVSSLGGQCPMPADITRAAYDRRQAKVLAFPGNRNECPTCGGTGMRTIRRTVHTSYGHEYEATGAEPCACREVPV